MAPFDIITELPRLARRAADSNKGSYGKVLVVAGSRGMSGAAVLCGSGALRGGAGLVTVAVPEEILPIVAAGNPCYLTAALPQDKEGRLSSTAALPQDKEGRLSSSAEARVLELAQVNTVAGVGPGLGRSAGITSLVASWLKSIRIPVVLDADGINAFAGQIDSLKDHAASLILTPHPGEFARLLGCDIPTVQARRQELAAEFAQKYDVVVVLKGHGTVVTDGRRVFVNQTGNPGMATGGTGDVLTGLIAALLGQGLEPFQAAQLGVHLHGLTGDLAQLELGEASMIASDLLIYLPHAFRQACNTQERKR
jgi:ADP-dependent NAD(P)H-hydrate dehydratase